MATKSLIELKSILQAEKLDALAAVRASKLSVQRSDATDYYMGDMSKDMPAADGRSRAVSTDVADTIEGLMPSLMEIFSGGDEVVKFEPVGPEDEKAAQQETDYVNYVFNQQNPGFIVLYSMIKDALLHKVGVVKVWWSEEEVEEKRTYYNLDDQQLMMLLQDQDIEIIEHTVKDSPDDDDEGEIQKVKVSGEEKQDLPPDPDGKPVGTNYMGFMK